MREERPLVSIYCLTYNHEKFISDCLEGFISQQTDFSFEVIVHDDASIDGTQAIVRDYEEKYPDIIRPIYQKQNQFSLQVNPVNEFVFPLVRGKYVAICEGDDYWTDIHKLQEQVSIMEDHPDCHFCVCGVQEVSVNKTALGVNHPDSAIHERFIAPEDFIRYAGTYSFQTSSYLMRYDDWREYIQNEPRFKVISDIGDLPMLLYFGSLGTTAYIDKVMSCYRRGAPSSYSAKKSQWSEEERIGHLDIQMNVWRLFDEFSKHRFHWICARKVADNMLGYCVLQYQAKQFLQKENRDYFVALPKVRKAFVLLACVLKRTMKRYYISVISRKEKKELAVWESIISS